MSERKLDILRDFAKGTLTDEIEGFLTLVLSKEDTITDSLKQHIATVSDEIAGHAAYVAVKVHDPVKKQKLLRELKGQLKLLLEQERIVLEEIGYELFEDFVLRLVGTVSKILVVAIAAL